MSEAKDWTTTWRDEYKAERGSQLMYDGTAREVAQAKGWRIIETPSADMVLAERSKGVLVAIGALPLAHGFGFWSCAIQP